MESMWFGGRVEWGVLIPDQMENSSGMRTQMTTRQVRDLEYQV